MPTIPMEEALEAVQEGRSHLVVALGILEKRRDMPTAMEELRSTVGFLAGLITSWSRERDRWQ